MRPRRYPVVGLVAAVALVGAVVQAGALTPVKVVVEPGEQYWPSSNGEYVVWTDQDRDIVFYKRLPDGRPRRVNPVGTFGEQGSFVTGAPSVVVYGQWTSKRHGDVYFFNLKTKARTKAPGAVNGDRTWEWAPTASKNYLMFMRDSHLLLYDRHAETIRVLEKPPSDDWYYRPTYAGMTYVLWHVWTSPTGRIHYWSRSGGEQVQPLGEDDNQIGGFLDEASGDLYYINMSNACGRFTILQRVQLGSRDTPVVLWKMRSGYVAGERLSVATDPDTGHLDLYYQSWSCEKEDGDIYALPGVDTV